MRIVSVMRLGVQHIERPLPRQPRGGHTIFPTTQWKPPNNRQCFENRPKKVGSTVKAYPAIFMRMRSHGLRVRALFILATTFP